MNDDLTLLRRYEPVIRYTHGEFFYPMDASRYVEQAALWVRRPYSPAREIVPHGGLTLDRLGSIVPPNDANGLYFLQFVSPLTGRQLQRALMQRDRPAFAARGRLARVGLTARIVDALFTITLLLRGTVPGGTAIAAEVAYAALQARDERYTYYGRVLRQDGYVVLHYLFFYCMNDWRSSFHGVNDHEADWEQIFVYLEADEAGEHQPAWVGYAMHDYSGDDLRRRWDDPEIEKAGTHPVIYAGAGSHASYFSRGEYLVEVSLSPFKRLIRVLETLQRFWRITLRQGDPDAPPNDIAKLFRIPFVDYARGDGSVVGPGGDKPWTPVLLEPVPEWASDYRGLWGFYAHDPVSGENAPAGPKFNRDGSIRRAWHNPLGWAGLQKVKPPGTMDDVLRAELTALREMQGHDEAEAVVQREHVAQLYARSRALRDQSHLEDAYRATWAETRAAEWALNGLMDTIAERDEIIKACERQLAQVESGDYGDARAHIRRVHQPQSAEEIRVSALAESWAAFSVGLLLVGFVLLYLSTSHWVLGLAGLIGLFVLIEALFQHEIEPLVVRATLALSIVAALLLIYAFFWEIAITGVMAVGLLIIADNVRELRH
ncbi:hypothetical protein [Aggregatilinea lenta]|uniref:hypothetical protein n=1 Tax=Aggregatilinea lenta TaxID=913108 RepID=UPI000E5A1492|nr:hypothetical protein [Aggregatilinea lenta]